MIKEYGTGGVNEPASKVFFSEMLTYLCKQISVPCFLWDNGGELDRKTYEFKTDGLEQVLNRALEIGEEPTKESVEETTAA